MKPQARIQAVIEILQNITDNTRVPMDTVVGDYMRSRRYIGSKDRSNIAERIYDVQRHYARLGWWLSHLKAEDTARNRMILWLILGEGADEKRIKDMFDASNYAPEKLGADEIQLIVKAASQDIHHKDMPEDVLAECPPLYAEKLKAYFGSDFVAEMQAMLSPATLDLRVNIFTSDMINSRKSLEKDGVKTQETPYSPWGLRCEEKAYLSKTKAFHKGWIEIQDEGSQLIAAQCDVQPGMQVLDFCAGGGGKTLALGSAMLRKGRIVAMDNDTRRLERGRQRYKKAGIADIVELRSLEEERHRKWLKKQKQKFDVVLLDVPCSGTGTWRRNPDMRWTTYGPSLEELKAIQADILDKACHTVKEGGKLVYATCSLLPDENEAQVEAFLKAHPEFELQPITDERLGKPYMRLTPHRHNTDGFFAAVMIRKEQ